MPLDMLSSKWTPHYLLYPTPLSLPDMPLPMYSPYISEHSFLVQFPQALLDPDMILNMPSPGSVPPIPTDMFFNVPSQWHCSYRSIDLNLSINSLLPFLHWFSDWVRSSYESMLQALEDWFGDSKMVDICKATHPLHPLPHFVPPPFHRTSLFPY